MPLVGRKYKVAHIHAEVQKASVNYPGHSLFLLLLAFLATVLSPHAGQESDMERKLKFTWAEIKFGD